MPAFGASCRSMLSECPSECNRFLLTQFLHLCDVTKPSELTSLVERAQDGDAEAFGVLVLRYQNAAYAITLERLSRRADCDDVVQEAFVAAWCKLRQLRDPAKFGAWFRRVVAAECLMWTRRHRSRSSTFSTEVVGEVLVAESTDPESRMAHRRIWAAVDDLPHLYRTAVFLHYLSGFSYSEIADFLDVPVSTVKGRIQQGRARLREIFSIDEWRGIIMDGIDVSDEVQELVYQIATQRMRGSASMSGLDNAVLFLGVPASIDIRQKVAAA